MRRPVGRGLLALLPVLALTACAGSVNPPTTYTAYQLTCCTHADIESPWQPGTTVDLHLISTTSEVTTVKPSHRVRITAKVSGPFKDAATLKQGGKASAEVSGSPVVFDDRVDPSSAAVIQFSLPADLPPGLYNLDMSWDFGDGSSASSGSIVQVGF